MFPHHTHHIHWIFSCRQYFFWIVSCGVGRGLFDCLISSLFHLSISAQCLLWNSWNRWSFFALELTHRHHHLPLHLKVDSGNFCKPTASCVIPSRVLSHEDYWVKGCHFSSFCTSVPPTYHSSSFHCPSLPRHRTPTRGVQQPLCLGSRFFPSCRDLSLILYLLHKLEKKTHCWGLSGWGSETREKKDMTALTGSKSISCEL